MFILKIVLNHSKRSIIVAISGELVGGAADLEDITNITLLMTELKRTIDRSIAKKKEENNMLGQMQQQIQEYEQDYERNAKVYAS